MLADTSSAPAGNTLETGPNAAELASLSADPIFDRSDAAAARYSGDAIRYDIRDPPHKVRISLAPRRRTRSEPIPSADAPEGFYTKGGQIFITPHLPAC